VARSASALLAAFVAAFLLVGFASFSSFSRDSFVFVAWSSALSALSTRSLKLQVVVSSLTKLSVPDTTGISMRWISSVWCFESSANATPPLSPNAKQLAHSNFLIMTSSKRCFG
jgi:hypothetical protein